MSDPASPSPTPHPETTTAEPGADSRLSSADLAALAVLVSTAMLSFKGILAKFAYAEGLGTAELLAARFVLAAPLFWLGVRFLARGVAPLTRRQWGVCAIGGVLMAVATGADFAALQTLDVGLSRIVLFTFPIFVIGYTAVLDRAWPKRRDVGVLAGVWCGLLLVVGPAVDTGAADWAGLALALTASLAYAGYLVFSERAMRTIGSPHYVAGANSVIAGLMVLLLLGSTDVSTLSGTTAGYGWAAIIAVACTMIPFFLMLEGIRRAGSTQTALIHLSGPAMSVVLAWLLLSETMSPVQILGVLVVLAGMAVLKGMDRMILRRLRGSGPSQR